MCPWSLPKRLHMSATGRGGEKGDTIITSRSPCCVLLALSWNTNEYPSTDKLSRAITYIITILFVLILGLIPILILIKILIKILIPWQGEKRVRRPVQPTWPALSGEMCSRYVRRGRKVKDNLWQWACTKNSEPIQDLIARIRFQNTLYCLKISWIL